MPPASLSRRRVRPAWLAHSLGPPAPRLVVAVVVGMTGLVGVVVGGRGGANLLLEAGESDAVDADVAVHADVALKRLAVALEYEIRDPRVGTEVASVADLEAGVLSGEPLGLFPDAPLQDAGEEEVGEDGDAPDAEPPARSVARGSRRRSRRAGTDGPRRRGGPSSQGRCSSPGRRSRVPPGGRRSLLSPLGERRRRYVCLSAPRARGGDLGRGRSGSRGQGGSFAR